jgi:hypothetical protein
MHHPAAMRIHLDDRTLLPDLAGYLRRCDCLVEERGRHVLEASPALTSLDPSHTRIELEAYLRIWQLRHPGVKVEVFASASAPVPRAR